MVETTKVSTIFFTKKGIHMRNNIRIYEVKSEYIKYLSNYQKHIFAQTDGKDKRKYISIVFEGKGSKYFLLGAATDECFIYLLKFMVSGTDGVKWI